MDSNNISSLEVEQKFEVPVDISSRLEALGAVLVKELSYHDVYLDSSDNELALSGARVCFAIVVLVSRTQTLDPTCTVVHSLTSASCYYGDTRDYVLY